MMPRSGNQLVTVISRSRGRVSLPLGILVKHRLRRAGRPVMMKAARPTDRLCKSLFKINAENEIRSTGNHQNDRPAPGLLRDPCASWTSDQNRDRYDAIHIEGSHGLDRALGGADRLRFG
jgi:hypothetical protein